MNDVPIPASPDANRNLDPNYEPPPGDHALEIAARAGLGPLSPLRAEVWHGQARPCVSCGQLVKRNATICHYCDQNLGDDMLRKMRAHAGPWYVLEHVRPFPGVTLERIVRQIRRGVIEETSIVRGPETNHQWRFAVETPGLCRFFGKCWRCHQSVELEESHCSECGVPLGFGIRPGATEGIAASAQNTDTASEDSAHEGRRIESPATFISEDEEEQAVRDAERELQESAQTAIETEQPAVPAENQQTREWEKLTYAVKKASSAPREEHVPRVMGIRATWIAIILLILAMIVLGVMQTLREQSIS